MGKVITGRDGYEAAQAAWGPHPPFECEIFVLTHHPGPDEVREGTTFHGASPIRQAIAAGVLATHLKYRVRR